MNFRPFALAAIALLAAGMTSAQPTLQSGYLSAAAMPDTLAILPPAPAPDSPRALADRAVFKATRALKGGPRWALAQNDVNELLPVMLGDFSCAAGARLSEASAPRLSALLARLRFDVITAVNRPKNVYQRQRPYLVDDGDICVERTDSLAKSPDYPSGHATWGWSVGLVLAELDPAHATAVLGRARAFGESRVVCGVHNASAIEAARTNAAAVIAAAHGDAAFRADLDAARAEMAALAAAGGTDAKACAAEFALTAKTPW